MVLRLSVLDQSIAAAGRPHGQAIRDTVALASHCETLGYHRFWVSEHHNHPSILGTAPEVLIAALAMKTERIRIGSAGVMLPHYSALKVAEQFRVLDALAPGRIDLGLGRAPGSDGLTAYALHPMANERPHQFPADVRDILAWIAGKPLAEGHTFAQIRAYPAGDTVPEVWMLGSSNYGAQVAAHFGLPYCFAWFFTDGQGAAEALRMYREGYQPSERHPEAIGGLCVWALAADSEEEGAAPLHAAGAVAAAAPPGPLHGAGNARGRRRPPLYRSREGRSRPVPQAGLRRHAGPGGRTDRSARERARRAGNRRRHLDPRRGGQAAQLRPPRRGFRAGVRDALGARLSDSHDCHPGLVLGSRPAPDADPGEAGRGRCLWLWTPEQVRGDTEGAVRAKRGTGPLTPPIR